MKWKLKEVRSLKRVEGVFDSNLVPEYPSLEERAFLGVEMIKRVRKSTHGKVSTRILTNSKCIADELHLRYDDQKTKQQSRDGNVPFLARHKSRDGNVSFSRHGGQRAWIVSQWGLVSSRVDISDV